MKTIKEKLSVSAGTRILAECLVGLNNNYEEVVKALNVAFGSNEISGRMFSQEYLPAFLELQKVLKGFIAESVTQSLESEEINEI